MRFSEWYLTTWYRWHPYLYRWSGGRIGKRTNSGPILVLTTTGRKTSARRIKALSYLADEAGYVVMASKGGADVHPDWYLNLAANPEVEVQIGGTRWRTRARTANATERARLWPKVVVMWEGYEDFQRQTKREIPLVILEPKTD